MSDTLDLLADPIDLTAALVDVRSVSGEEAEIAELVERSLKLHAPHLEITRSGNAVLARTNLGKQRRVVLAGHLDTVPINQNFPSRREGDILHGCGTVDMKGGDAVMLAIAALSQNASHDLTFVFYDCEEIEAERNGLTRIQRDLVEWLHGDLAIVCEPSNGTVEAGCQGTMRIEIKSTGKRAHTARGWMGRNAIHGVGEALRRLEAYEPRQPEIDGCRYHEGLQAVKITGGVAGNVVPDECTLTVNHRFAPDRSVQQAEQHLREVFEGYDVTVTDFAAGALPGLHAPAAQELVAAAGGTPVAKLGWTDVARFAALGMPAVNFGPGDPTLAHTQEENVPVDQITGCFDVLKRFLLA
ncbi:succinyl-diaminopimelate desuccinylase [Lentzea sp. NPDC051213]|uniref:succinyl-diaminopimelate desuccinylase n=1 Tax=Lentzea sp. NPDC051213 TaxID=3364126 RepID=UPI0037AD613B